MTLYKLRKLLMAPYIWHMRRKESHQTGFMKLCLELYYYRSAFCRLAEATDKNPHILYDAPIGKGAIVVDVGGYDGVWAQYMVALHQPVIYSFEPDPANFPTLQQRFQDNPDVHCFDFGLGRSDCTLTLTQLGMGSTLYSPDDTHSKFVVDLGLESSAVDVRVRDIVGVFDELGFTNVDLLKINIEGGEYDVLERLLETGRMKDVNCLMVQFHEWFDNAHWRRLRIRHKLRKTHREVWNYPFIWEQWVKKDAPMGLKSSSEPLHAGTGD
jgi:FkbM family methyltransferase